MKKYILLFICIFLFSGCTIKYDLVINDSTIKENTYISSSNSDVNIENFKLQIDNINSIPQTVFSNADINPYDEYEIIEGVDYYNKEIISNDNNYGLKLNYNFNKGNYNVTRVMSECYELANVINNYNELIIATNKENKCFKMYNNIETIEINIKIKSDKYKVVENNADRINNNKYTWYINNNNYNDKSIVIRMNKNHNKNQDKEQNSLYAIYGVLAVILIVVVTFVTLIGKKNNKL